MNTDNTNQDELISEDDITKAMEELNGDSIAPVSNEGDDLTKGDDNDDDDGKGKTNAKVEDDGKEDKDGDSYKAVKQGKMTYYQKGDKYYTKGEDGKYTEASADSMKKAGWKTSGAAASAAAPNVNPKRTKNNVVAKGDDGEVVDNAQEEGAPATESPAEDEFNRNADGLTKAEVDAKLNEDDNLQKALEENPALKTLNDSINAIADSQIKKSQATGTILKGVMESIASLKEDIATIGQNSQGRKSATSQPVERFAKGGDGEGEGKVLSIAKDRGQILEAMDKLTFKGDNMDNDMAKAMTYFEGNGILSKGAAIAIEKEFGVSITD